MSRRTNQSGARPIHASRDEDRRRGGRSTSGSGYQHGVYATTQVPNESAQHGQTSVEGERAWRKLNPELQRVINDPRLDYTYESPAVADDQTCTYPPCGSSSQAVYGSSTYQSTYAYSDQQQACPQYSASNQGFGGRLTAGQLYIHNYGQQVSDRTEAWRGQAQREGPWYGYVKHEYAEQEYVEQGTAQHEHV